MDEEAVTKPTTLPEALMVMLEEMKAVAQAAAGYREECERLGFSPTMAEMMAAGFHTQLLATMMGASTKGSAK